MKQKYILETYDQILKEIKNPRIIFSADLNPFLDNFEQESFLIYQVNFIKKNGEIKYKIKEKIHSLHPKASKIKVATYEAIPEFEGLLPEILEELKIQNTDKKFRWTSYNDNNTLFILVKCEIEDLSQEKRFFLYCYHSLKNENDKIKKINKERIFNFKSKRRIEEYIHKKQFALGNLAHRLVKEINPVNFSDMYQFSTNYDKTDCLKITYIYLEKLLRFIEKEYRDYLNVNIQIPYRSILLKEFEITEKLNFVKSSLLESNINQQLLKLTYEPLLKLSQINIQEKLTYYDFNYSSEYIVELYFQLKLFKNEITESEIENCLFDLNYNTLCFFSYKTEAIKEDLDNYESDVKKIDVLYKLLKTYNQRQTRSFIKFDLKLPSIKEQIINWLEEEIQYLHKKAKLDTNQIQSVIYNEDKVKFLTVLSVAQLSCFFGLLLKSEIIKHPNHRDIFRFIAENFKTNSTDKISLDSISSKYYNIESNTKNSVREKIIELLNLAKP